MIFRQYRKRYFLYNKKVSVAGNRRIPSCTYIVMQRSCYIKYLYFMAYSCLKSIYTLQSFPRLENAGVWTLSASSNAWCGIKKVDIPFTRIGYGPAWQSWPGGAGSQIHAKRHDTSWETYPAPPAGETRIAVCYRTLPVSRQGFYQYLVNQDRPWKYQSLAGAMIMPDVKETWGGKYPYALNNWEQNREDVSPFSQFSDDIRRIMYTTNIIEEE